MEFSVRLDSPGIDQARIEQQLRNIDPAGIVDFDATKRILRVSTVLSDLELAAFLHATGHPFDASHIERLPSVCCGGC